METKTYKFGIAGTGLIAPFQAKAIQAMEGAELVAFHGRNAERVKELAAEYGCAGYTDYDEFLKHDGLDVVSVCTRQRRASRSHHRSRECGQACRRRKARWKSRPSGSTK